jgi:predicted AAA+ superfamily ATPase
MVHQVKRYDLKGKKILEYSEKYYPADIGLRFSTTGYSDTGISGILENIVYLELLHRGYHVYVGWSGTSEVDFIAEKQEEKLYIQVTYLLDSEKTIEREFGNLMKIDDNYPKLVISMDEFWPKDVKGIARINLIDFLIGKIAGLQ